MSERLLMLLERAPSEAIRFADIVANALVADLGVEEMRNSRGAGYNITKYYQIRVKPKDKAQPLEDILRRIEGYLKKNQKALDIKRVQVNPRAFNSGKYASVSFEYGGVDFDVVVAAGANRGETFEKELLLKMDNLVAGIESSAEAVQAFEALRRADRTFKVENIKAIAPRSGTTHRAGDMSPEEVGRVIADIIVKMKQGPDRYISVKDRTGSTLAQFGISKAFNDDLSVNTATAEWRRWLQPFGLDPKKVQDGLIAAATGIQQPWPDIEAHNQVLTPGSDAYKVIEKMWGSNYYYLRKVPGGFKALHITPEFVHNVLLRGLKITEIRYPSPARKQISIYLENEVARYKLEVRNPRGKGEVRPTQIQLILQRSEL